VLPLISAVEAIAMMHKGGGFKWSSDAEERDKLWSARKAALFAAMFVQPDRKVLTTDVCVPISKFPDAISDTKADILATGLFAPIVGHIGDGNYHVIIMFDPNSPQETSAAQGLNVRMVKRAIALQGTCTGEHGVGQGKAVRMLAGVGWSGDVSVLLS
jgi:D-lactate dehydrogenase (cytochrome)